MAEELSRYDLELSARGAEGEEERVAFMFYDGERVESPASVTSDSTVDQGTAVIGQKASGEYTVKDQRGLPAYLVNNYQHGQGQASLETSDASAEAFWEGWCIDCHRPGEFRPSKAVYLLPNTTLTGVCRAGRDSVFFAHELSGSPAYATLSYLVHYTVHSGALAADGTSVVLSDPALSVENPYGVTPEWAEHDPVDFAPQAGDWIYDPLAREVLVLGAESPSGTFVVPAERAYVDFHVDPASDPLARKAHAVNEDGVVVWEAWGLRDVPITNAPQDLPIVDIGYVGDQLYLLFSASNVDGEVYGGPIEGPLVSVISKDAVRKCAYSTGYFYVATDDALFTLGWVTDHWEWGLQISGVGAIEPGATTVALEPIGQYVYWAVQCGDRGQVFRCMQGNTGGGIDPVFENAANLPKGFHVTDLADCLGHLFIAGYEAGFDDVPWVGRLYLASGDTLEPVAELKVPEHENRIRGVTSFGPYLRLVTDQDVYVYSAEHAGWWHSYQIPPAEIDTVLAPVADELLVTLDHNPTSDGWTESYSTNPPSLEYPGAGDHAGALVARGDNGRWRRWTRSNDPGVFEIAGTATMILALDGFERHVHGPLPRPGSVERRGAEWSIQNGERQTKARFIGVVEDGYWRTYLKLGRWKPGSSEWVFDQQIGPIPGHMGTAGILNLSPEGASLGAHGERITVPLAGTRPTTNHNVWFSVGIDSSVSDNKFEVALASVRVVNSWGDQGQIIRAYTPPPIGQFAVIADADWIPIPGNCLVYSNPAENRVSCDTFEDGTPFNPTRYVSSETYVGQGTILKNFHSLEVAHSPLLAGQFIQLACRIDGAPMVGEIVEGWDPDESDPTAAPPPRLTTLPIRQAGSAIQLTVQCWDSEARPLDDQLRVRGQTLRFLPAGSLPKEVYALACYDNVECHDERLWDYDAVTAKDFLFACCRDRRVVRAATTDGDYSAYVEQVQYYPHTSDRRGGQGLIVVSLRAIE